MGIASFRLTAERAGNQQLPDKVHELLPTREAEYGLTPGPYDSTASRNAALVARFKLPLGASKNNIKNALQDLLGGDFVAYRPTPYSEAVLTPSTIGAQPMNLQLPTVPRKLVQITSGISVGLGAPQTVNYTDVTPVAGQLPFTTALLSGEKLVVDPGATSQSEVVTVGEPMGTIVAPGPTGGSVIAGFFTATFNLAHDAGVVATTNPYPRWSSTKRASLIVVTAAAAADPEKRRRVDELLGRLTRGVSTWQIVIGTASSTSGPFRVGQGLIGITTIGAVSLP